jgi:hypothetical protein
MDKGAEIIVFFLRAIKLKVGADSLRALTH